MAQARRDPGVMLIWVAALHCEASPVIDFYRLKKSHRDKAFDLYLGDDMACIVSGVGKLASAAASAWIAARYRDEASLAWINIGTAGAARHDIGAIFLIDKIVDAETAKSYFPAPTSTPLLPGSACLTLAQPSRAYREDCLFDMEACGFISSALRFSSAELIRCIKVVSDNRHAETGRNREQVSALIRHHIESIERQATDLLALDDEVAALEFPAESWQRLLAMAHFTQTQQNRLRVLWRYLCNRNLGPEALLQELSTRKTAASMIETLERISYSDSETL
ncbi:MAG: hypothetical protein OEN02_12700 [Gammaproteobacteria bacterium]|nr:hypothetical protein [Gammaproteobacteria bacterium]MDH3537308.1 hypothetical protein [Gammaproteobacteria bacterium]